MESNETLSQEESLTRPLIGYQEVEVCLPITVKPYAKTGPIRTKCCGSAIIRPGLKTCSGVKDGDCSFTVTQKLRVDIPIIFGAQALTGESYVCCFKPCADLCNDIESEEYGEDEEA